MKVKKILLFLVFWLVVCVNASESEEESRQEKAISYGEGVQLCYGVITVPKDLRWRSEIINKKGLSREEIYHLNTWTHTYQRNHEKKIISDICKHLCCCWR